MQKQSAMIFIIAIADFCKENLINKRRKKYISYKYVT